MRMPMRHSLLRSTSMFLLHLNLSIPMLNHFVLKERHSYMNLIQIYWMLRHREWDIDDQLLSLKCRQQHLLLWWPLQICPRTGYRHFIVASHRSYFPDFFSINISYDTSDLVEPDNEYVGIVCFNRYVKEPAGCNSTSKGNAFNVRKFELAILQWCQCRRTPGNCSGIVYLYAY